MYSPRGQETNEKYYWKQSVNTIEGKKSKLKIACHTHPQINTDY